MGIRKLPGNSKLPSTHATRSVHHSGRQVASQWPQQSISNDLFQRHRKRYKPSILELLTTSKQSPRAPKSNEKTIAEPNTENCSLASKNTSETAKERPAPEAIEPGLVFLQRPTIGSEETGKSVSGEHKALDTLFKNLDLKNQKRSLFPPPRKISSRSRTKKRPQLIDEIRDYLNSLSPIISVGKRIPTPPNREKRPAYLKYLQVRDRYSLAAKAKEILKKAQETNKTADNKVKKEAQTQAVSEATRLIKQSPFRTPSLLNIANHHS